MRRFLLTLATAATALSATACSDATGVGRDLEGTYTLETVNGASLPEYVAELDVEFVSGEVTLYRDGTYDYELRFRVGNDPFVERFTSFGTYSVSGDEIRFNPDDPDEATYFMEWDRSRLIERDNEVGLTFVFRR